MNKRIKKKRLSKQLEYIFGAIGYIFYLTSLIEYNLVQIIAAEEYLKVFDQDDISFIDIITAKEDSNKTLHKLADENKMLGKLITLLEKIPCIDTELIDKLRKVSEIRGYYAHKFYKDDLFKNYLEKNPLVYKKGIGKDINFIFEVHNEVAEIDEAYRMVAKKSKGTWVIDC